MKRTLEETIDERVQKAINDVMNKMKKTECISFELKPGHMSPPIVPSSVGSVQEFVSGTKYPVDVLLRTSLAFFIFQSIDLGQKQNKLLLVW